MMRAWLGVALLAVSWLLGLGYYYAPACLAWGAAVVAGYFFGEDHAGLPEGVGAAIERDLNRITGGEWSPQRRTVFPRPFQRLRPTIVLSRVRHDSRLTVLNHPPGQPLAWQELDRLPSGGHPIARSQRSTADQFARLEVQQEDERLLRLRRIADQP